MMSRVVLAVGLSLATVAIAQQPARVASLQWMAGTWSVSQGEETVTESWVGPGNGLMVAVNLTTTGTTRKSFEFLRIGDTPEGFSYFASPGGRPAVEFKMKEQAGQRVVFENPAHDFPRRILYWREGENLMARVEGSIGGKERNEEWRFSRAR